MSYMSQPVLHRSVTLPPLHRRSAGVDTSAYHIISVLNQPPVTLDPTFVPAKYHPFIIPGLRRIYLNADPSRSSASRELQEQVSALKKENEDLASKLRGRDRDVKLLMAKCESNMAAVATHSKGERDARLENERLRREVSQFTERYKALQAKLYEREHRPGSSVEGDTRLSDDRRDHPRNPR